MADSLTFVTAVHFHQDHPKTSIFSFSCDSRPALHDHAKSLPRRAGLARRTQSRLTWPQSGLRRALLGRSRMYCSSPIKLRLAFGCLVLFAVSAVAEPRLLTPQDLWAIKRVGNPAFSPDGRHAVFPVQEWTIEKNKSTSNLWTVAVTDGEVRQFTTADTCEDSPRWSPDGTRIAFTSKRGHDENGSLYVIPFAGGEAEKILELPSSMRRRSGWRTARASSSRPRRFRAHREVGEGRPRGDEERVQAAQGLEDDGESDGEPAISLLRPLPYGYRRASPAPRSISRPRR